MQGSHETETGFRHKSEVRELQIKDALHLIKRGSRSISKHYSSIQISVEDTYNGIYVHGLFHEFSTFSTTLTLFNSNSEVQKYYPQAWKIWFFFPSPLITTQVPLLMLLIPSQQIEM